MKSFIFLFVITLSTIIPQEKIMDNPLLKEWNTPFGTPPVDEIKDEHFLPAIKYAVELQKKEIEAIASNSEEPTFENTIEAMEKSGSMLDRVSRLFDALNEANTNEKLQKAAREITPILTRHEDDIYLNEKLYKRVKVLYEKKESLGLNPEQMRLLEFYYKDFVRSGADLPPEKKEELRKINEEISSLALKFSENLLKETNAVALVIDNKEDLVGLPKSVIQLAAENASAKGYEGKWVFTLQKPSWIPFLQYSPKRELREKLFKAYIKRGNNNNEYDNKEIIARIVSLRVKRANLLGYKTHADYVLEVNMAKTPDRVYKFLHELWTPALKRAKSEVKQMQKIIESEGNNFKLQAWDWWYYAEKLKREKYNLDEEMLRPYFKMENVLKGAFEVASKLYGIKFIERNDIQTYHPDVKVFEVVDENDKHIGIFYTDYYPRDGKRSGAWSSSFRVQTNIDGNFVTPLVYNVGNFSKPTADKPALMSVDEVNTLFHELGHALHSLLSNTTYHRTKWVPRDFVELPSQIMENWALEPEVLKLYAKHYKTGEPMQDELIAKIENSKLFNQGFETVEYLAAAFLDMDWHTLTDTAIYDVEEFEKKCFDKLGKIPEIESRYQTTNFAHIVGGYSAGYYSYIWSAVLDADAFEAFKEKGDLFDKETANAFGKLLAKGGTKEPMQLYIEFRGREPKVDALLKRRGLN
ncbi:M3 family metallopeptidase [Melioribacter sp. OK-6-Me]|uniref:M3 family metallopeptidase n=1 Tax=unclassified Melioribacter TaxID=2627329 RepID=UPI003EDAA204